MQAASLSSSALRHVADCVFLPGAVQSFAPPAVWSVGFFIRSKVEGTQMDQLNSRDKRPGILSAWPDPESEGWDGIDRVIPLLDRHSTSASPFAGLSRCSTEQAPFRLDHVPVQLQSAWLEEISELQAISTELQQAGTT